MAMSKPRRRWLWLLLPLAALIGFFVLRALLEPERVSAFLLRQAEQATGLALSLDQPADIGIWPDLHLELIGLRATAPGTSVPLLNARRVEVALPWSALRSETLQLQRLRLIEPKLGMPALQAWLAQGDDAGPPAPLRLPQLDALLEIEAGTVTGDGWQLQDFALSLPSLHNGVATTLVASGSLSTTTDVHGFDLRLDTTPTLADFDIALKPLKLDLGTTLLPDVRLQLDGELHYGTQDALRFGLATVFAEWPAAWPPLPFADAKTPIATSLQVNFAGTSNLQGDVDLLIVRGEDRIEGQLQLGDLLAWIDAPDANPLPPLGGTISAPRLHFDGIEASGVSLRFDEDLPPADPDAKR